VIAHLLLATQVVLWHSYRAEEEAGLLRCAQMYNVHHPDTRLEVVAVPYDAYSNKLEAAIPRGNGPDLFVSKHDDIGEWSKAGLIEPLPIAIDDAQFLDGTLAPLRVDGKLWGLPLTFKSLALYYRTDKLAAPPATTDELVREGKRVGFAYESGNLFYHAIWLHGFGGRFLDENNRPELNSPAAIQSMAFLKQLAAILPEESSSTVATQLFNDGRVAITINGPWFTGEITAGVPFAVAPLPTVSATGKPAAPLVNMEAVMLAARARQPAAAIEIARWLASTEAARVRATVGHQTVADRAAWDDPEIARDPILGAFRKQLAATVPMSNSPAMRQVWEPGQRALRRVLRGAADPEPALDEAQRQVVEALRPAPPPVSPTPYLIAAGIACAGLLAWLLAQLRRGGGDGFAWWYMAPAALGMVVLVFVPFAVGGGMSLFHYDVAGAVKWVFVGLRNFADILGTSEFYLTLGVTVLWTVANVSLHVLVGVTLALLLRDPALRLRGIYRVLLIIPWAVPNYITALIWKGMFHRQFGAINGMLAFVGVQPISWFSQFSTAFCANLATNVWLGFPFMMVVTLGALSRIPKELEEAASLDGAGRWQRLRHVIFPLLKPALLPSVLLGAVWTFNMFNIVFLVSGGEPDGATEILVSQAYRWAFTRGHRYGYAAAYAVLIFGVLAVQSALSRKVTPEVDA
jgi:arabinogalactan oligomer / maltooligosaccharide transport system permease protein